METVTILRWTLFAVATGIWYYTVDKECKKPGWLSVIDAIMPTVWYMLFIIVWLIVFLAIL